MSARSRASRARSTEKYSVPRSVRDCRRMPAVSTKQTGPSGVSTTVSTASRVVPGHVVDDRALVADQPVEQGRLADVGPPDQGHPAAVHRCRGPAPRVRRRGRPPLLGAGQRAAGSRSTTSSSRSPVPRPWSALTGHGSPRPRAHELPGAGLAVGVVDLVDDQQHRRARPPEDPGHGQVLVGHPDGHVHHQQDHVGLGDGPLGLGADLGVERDRRRPASRRCRRR